ncbi:SlyX family protein [Rhodopirellula bahusiensis]|uniref:SlyX protein n=1 Tax=Rhodopirellula bahusiensis TaxID=2014065 RepID=A0A2G1VXE5_9BACT|nr:SlyX family protein [Rhodopirellula bahusiensis]PHQ31454.1 SlyX protein [Rhodopirellula bahusiensis]
MSLEDRITEVEIQLVHTQRVCDQLNEIVTEMSLEAQRRDREMKRLVDQLKDLKNKVSESGGDLEDERPPHY